MQFAKDLIANPGSRNLDPDARKNTGICELFPGIPGICEYSLGIPDKSLLNPGKYQFFWTIAHRFWVMASGYGVSKALGRYTGSGMRFLSDPS
eukprot:1331274-Amorphochlora_amoeboformis.AAC.1